MVLCTLPGDFEGTESCIWKAQADAAQHLSDTCLAFTAYSIYCKANQNWPLGLWSATNFRKRSTELLSEITFSALRGLLTAQFFVLFLFIQASKANGSFKVNKHGTLLGINGFALRPWAIQSVITTCSSHTFKKQKTKVIFLLVLFQTALLSSHLLKPAAITLVGTCHLYWKAAQPGWMILAGRYPAYLRCGERHVHCHSCLLTRMFANKKRVPSTAESENPDKRFYLYLFFQGRNLGVKKN